VSSIGDGMVVVALPLLALKFTHSPLLIAGVMVTGSAPAAIGGLPAGTLADRTNRRRLIVLIEFFRFLVLIAFGLAVLVHADGLVAIYLTAFALGAMNVAFDVVAGASLPAMVPSSQLVPANSHLINAEMTGQDIVGQGLGGLALSLARALPFIADAFSFVVSAILLNRAIPDSVPESSGESAVNALRSGLSWYFRHPVLRTLTGLLASLAFCQSMVFGVLVPFAHSRLHMSNTGYGFMLAVAGVGTVIGGYGASKLHKKLGNGGLLLLAGFLAAAVYPVLATVTSAITATLLLAIETMSVVGGNVAARSLRQSLVPDVMQGRAASAYSTVILSCIPLGALVGGVVAATGGTRTTLFTAGVIQVIFLLATGPRLYRRTRELSPKAEEPAPVVLELDADGTLTSSPTESGVAVN
jgi:predicted MFS family arabinose efflux permease